MSASLPAGPDPASVGQAMRFRTLLYRYFFFAWLFRDASRGSARERAAAWQHNQGQARWLPTYMRRWLLCGALLYCAGGFVETVLFAPVLAACFYIPGALSVPINAVLAVAWVGLKTLRVPN